MNINKIQKKADLFYKLSTRQKLHYDPSSVNPELNPVVSDEPFDVPNEPRHLEPKRKLLIHLPESIIPIIDEIIKIDEHISNAREKKSLMTDPEKENVYTIYDRLEDQLINRKEELMSKLTDHQRNTLDQLIARRKETKSL